MKKIFLVLCLLSVVACGDNDNNQPTKDYSQELAHEVWDNMITNLAEQEYKECLTHGITEFPNIKHTELEKTCKCVVSTIYLEDTKDSNGNVITDRFSIDFRAFLKDKCGKNIPNYTLRDIPDMESK
ncbi:MAG: hypothetical protein ACLRFJ_03530 [Alphaproteobacteria bacterium]